MELTYDTVSNQGERVLPEDRAELVRAHEARYVFAQRWVQYADKVLDCACGTGYGVRLLAQKAASVSAIDISPVAIAYAEKNFRAENVSYGLGSAEALPFPDGVFDVFCSFETIEHVDHPEKLVSEARRVLRAGGLFIVSTPNRIVNGLGPGEVPSNPFHKIEWSLKEFDLVLRGAFTDIQYFGQRVRCPNKLNGKYVSSKLRRALGLLDLVTIPRCSTTLEELESPRAWQPENFIAVCRR